MVYRFVFARWSIVPVPGWRIEVGTTGIDGRPLDHVKLSPTGGDAALILMPGRPPRPGELQPDRWVEACALMDRKKGREVVAVQLGDLKGYFATISSEVWIRHWSLHDGEAPFEIDYRCDAAVAGRDDVAVACMLNSLRPAPET